jgi:hypothetical protein
MRQVIIAGILVLGVTGAALAFDTTLGEVKRLPLVAYQGMVTGSLWTYFDQGLFTCPSQVASGNVVTAVLDGHPDYDAKPFTTAVGYALIDIGCTYVPHNTDEHKPKVTM